LVSHLFACLALSHTDVIIVIMIRMSRFNVAQSTVHDTLTMAKFSIMS